MIAKLITILICVQTVFSESSLKHQQSFNQLMYDAYFKDAKSVAELQLKVVREIKGEKDAETLLWMNNLAESEIALANFEESLRLLEIVELQSQVRSEMSTVFINSYLTALVLKVNAQYSSGLFERCKQNIQRTLDLIKVRKISDSKFVGRLHFLKAKYEIELGKSEKAEASLYKALEIFKKLNLPLWIAKVQQLLGEQKLKSGQLAEGRKLIDKSIMLRGELQLKRHPDWADALDGMAALLILSGNLGAPLSLVDKAQNIRFEIFDRNHPEHLKSLKMRAFLMETIGDNRNALKQQKSVKAKMQKLFKSNHPSYFVVNLTLSRLNTKLNKLPEAEKSLQEARLIYDDFFKGNDSKKIKMELVQAFMYAASAKYFKASSIYQKILKNKSFSGRSEVLLRAAEVLLLQGNSEAAELHLSERLNLLIENYGNSHPKVSLAMKKLAALYYEKENPKLSVKLIKDNLDKLVKQVGEDHPEVLIRLSELIFYQQIAKQLTEAAESFELALKIQKRNFGHDNPEVLETMNNLAGVYGLIGRKKQADNMLREIRLIQAGGNPQDKDILFENSLGSKN